MADDFPTLLQIYRERSGKSRNALAVEVGVDPSYLTRIEHGDRTPPRQHILEALSRALRLSVPERNRLYVSAGYAGPSIEQLGAWDDGLQAYCDVMNDFSLSDMDRTEFRRMMCMLAARWRGVMTAPGHVVVTNGTGHGS